MNASTPSFVGCMAFSRMSSATWKGVLPSMALQGHQAAQPPTDCEHRAPARAQATVAHVHTASSSQPPPRLCQSVLP